MKRKRNTTNNRNTKRIRTVKPIPSIPYYMVNTILTRARKMKIRNAILKTRRNNPWSNYNQLASLTQWELPIGINKKEINDEIRRLRIINII